MGITKKNIPLNQNPSVSVVIATYNSEKTIDACLKAIRTQVYPQNKIDIILCDGGSIDSTFSLVKKYKVDFVPVPRHLQNAEYNKGVGVRKAKGDVILMIDHDNIIPHKHWLQKMVKPLVEDPEIVGVETLRYHYSPELSLIDRYYALFGAGDPVAFYLGKADRLSFIYDKYNLRGDALDKGNYYKVKFKNENIPTLGANGFVIRRKLLIENARIDGKNFFHIDVNVDLIRKSFNTYAFIKDDIIHLTGYKNITSFLYRRILFMEQFHVQQISQRRYSLFMKGDLIRLIIFIIYSITFVKPLFDSVRGYLKIKDNAWFVHPILCFSMVIIYGSITIKSKVFPNGEFIQKQEHIDNRN